MIRFSISDTFLKQYAQVDISKIFDRVRKTVRRESENAYGILISDFITMESLDSLFAIAEDFEYISNEYSSNIEISKMLEENGIDLPELKILSNGLKLFTQKYKYNPEIEDKDFDQQIQVNFNDLDAIKTLIDDAVHDSEIPVNIDDPDGEFYQTKVEENENWEVNIDKIQEQDLVQEGLNSNFVPDASKSFTDLMASEDLFSQGSFIPGGKGVVEGIIPTFAQKESRHTYPKIEQIQNKMKKLAISILQAKEEGIIKSNEIMTFMELLSDWGEATKNLQYVNEIESFNASVNENKFLQVVDDVNEVIKSMRNLNSVLSESAMGRGYNEFRLHGKEEHQANVYELSIENREVLRELSLLLGRNVDDFGEYSNLFENQFNREQSIGVIKRVYAFIEKIKADVSKGDDSSILNVAGKTSEGQNLSDITNLMQIGSEPISAENVQSIYKLMRNLQGGFLRIEKTPANIKGLSPMYEEKVLQSPIKFDEALSQIEEKSKTISSLSANYSGEENLQNLQEIYDLTKQAIDPVIKSLTDSEETDAFRAVAEVQGSLNGFADLVEGGYKIEVFDKRSKSVAKPLSGELIDYIEGDDIYKARFSLVVKNDADETFPVEEVFYLNMPGLMKKEMGETSRKSGLKSKILEPVSQDNDKFVFENPFARLPLDYYLPKKGFNGENFVRSMNPAKIQESPQIPLDESTPQTAFNFSKTIKKEAFNLSKTITKKAVVNKKDNNTVSPGHICLSCIKFAQGKCDWGNKPGQSVLTFVGDNRDKLSDCSKYIPLDADLRVIHVSKENPMLKKAEKMKDSDLNMALYRKIRAMNDKQKEKLFVFWNSLFPTEYAAEMVDDENGTKAKNKEKKDRGTLKQPKKKSQDS